MIKYDKDGNPVKFPKPKGEPYRYEYDEEGNIKDLPKRVLLRNKSAMGGLQSMPMGQMRRNKAGTIERDYRETGGFVPVGIKEKADDVPAMLSKNEFVMTADAVRGIGDGNIEKGAQRLYDQMKTAEKRVV
jgi:YD repeat-containing protein